MYEYEIHQFVYTNVEEEDSPWKRGGWQILFYPTRLFDKKHLINLTNHLYPGMKDSDSKDSVFFTTLGDDVKLVVLHYTNLSEEKDRWGRGGKVICHGLFFPSSLWKKIPAPLDLLSLVAEHLLTTIEGALNYPLADKKTGDIRPISLPKGQVPDNFFIKPLEKPFYRQVAVLMNQFATGRFGEDKTLPILFKGTPSDVSKLMDQILPWVPEAHRRKIGWDPSYEKMGYFDPSLYEFPLKIIGFRENIPTSAECILIDLATEEINGAREVPLTPYEKWILKGKVEEITSNEIEMCEMCSRALTGFTVQYSGEYDFQVPRGFLDLTSEDIKGVFTRTLGQNAGVIGSLISEQTSEKEKMELLVRGLPKEEICALTLKAILKDNVKIGHRERDFLDSLRLPHEGMLQFMSRVWKRDRLYPGELHSLHPDELYSLIRYWVITEDATEEWLFDILLDNRRVVEKLLGDESARPGIIDYLTKYLSKTPFVRGIEQHIMEVLSWQGRELEVLDGLEDILQLVETYLESGRWDEKEFSILLHWATQNLPWDNVALDVESHRKSFRKSHNRGTPKEQHQWMRQEEGQGGEIKWDFSNEHIFEKQFSQKTGALPKCTVQDFPFAASFLLPERGIASITMEAPHRKRLLYVCMKFHHFSLHRLESLGFDISEIARTAIEKNIPMQGLSLELLKRGQYELFLSVISTFKRLGSEAESIKAYIEEAGPAIPPTVIEAVRKKIFKKGMLARFIGKIRRKERR